MTLTVLPISRSCAEPAAVCEDAVGQVWFPLDLVLGIGGGGLLVLAVVVLLLIWAMRRPAPWERRR